MIQTMPTKPLPVAVLISGGGTTLRNLIEKQQAGQLDVDFRLVVSSKQTAGGLRYANESGIESRVIAKKDFATPEEHSAAVFEACRECGTQLVVMGGYLEHLLIPDEFSNRVINIHPSLIPAFSGQGFYGMRVHQAVLSYGAKISGCTAHFVDNEYDHGPIIAQRSVTVLPEDTPESLQRRVFENECELLPEVLQAAAEGRLDIQARRVNVIEKST
ncbi:MAG: phosphoribosylglycinamide formyltransferase [Pirellulaceae bacterium]